MMGGGRGGRNFPPARRLVLYINFYSVDVQFSAVIPDIFE